MQKNQIRLAGTGDSPSDARPHPDTTADVTFSPYAEDTLTAAYTLVSKAKGDIFSLLTSPLLFEGTTLAANGLSKIAPLFSPPQNYATWHAICFHLGDLMRSTITIFDIDLATKTASDLYAKCSQITWNLQGWLSSGKIIGKEALQTGINDLIQSYAAKMSNLIQSQYRGILLCQYASTALSQLLILATIHPYADELQLQSSSSLTGKEYIKTEIKRGISKYLLEATASYKYGLREITDKSTASHIPAPPTWIDYNRYRSVAMTGGLDIIAMLPFFDIEYYPEPGRIPSSLLRRKLLSLLDTNIAQDSTVLSIRNIEEFENYANAATPVELLNNINHGYVDTRNISPVLDGLIYVKHQTVSTDGYEVAVQHNHTGTIVEDIKYIEMDFSGEKVYHVSGHYWGETAQLNAVLNTIQYCYGTGTNAKIQKLSFSQFPPLPQWSFSLSNPPESPSSPSLTEESEKFQERLIDIKIPPDQRRTAHSYLFGWHHAAIGKDMLPAHPHLPESKRKYVEAFYINRAAKHIRGQLLRLIPNPGFTGGDLVELSPKQDVEFMLKRDPARWFSGFYQARVWYAVAGRVPPEARLELRIISPNFPESRSNSLIPYSIYQLDIDNLKFTDFSFFTFPGKVLLTSAMTDIYINLTNISEEEQIIIDRLELIFIDEATTSDPDR